MKNVAYVGLSKRAIIFLQLSHCQSDLVLLQGSFGLERCPSDLNDFFDNWLVLGSTNYHVKLFMFVIVLWGLWNVHNKMRIQKRFPKSSHDVFNKIFQLMQKWCVLLKDQDARFIDSIMKEVKKWLMVF